MEAVIRRARPGDEWFVADMLLKLVEQHLDHDPDRFSGFITREGAAEFYKSRFGVSDAEVLVAEIDGSIVGFAYLEHVGLSYEDLLENAAWLHDIYVESNVRSVGVGSRLIEEAITAAKRLGADKLLLAAAAKNDGGQKFFEKAGFRPTMLEMTLNLK